MSLIRGYSDFLSTLNQLPSLKKGVVVDTNILISATYDSDKFFEPTQEFLNFVVEYEVPLYCNVNVRSEFLEIQRRIIFSETLFDFADTIDRSKLPMILASKLGKWSKLNKSRKDRGDLPLRLSEGDLKSIKLALMKISDGEKDLWSILCENRIGNKLSHLWEMTVSELGLNFLTVQAGDKTEHLDKAPDWNDTIHLIEQQGLSSSDAMILNMFFSSKYDALITSDLEIALTMERIKPLNKICFIPDHLRQR